MNKINPINFNRIAISQLLKSEQLARNQQSGISSVESSNVEQQIKKPSTEEERRSSWLFNQPNLVDYIFKQVRLDKIDFVEESVLDVDELQSRRIKQYIEATGGQSGFVQSRLFENGQSEIMLIGRFIFDHDNRLVNYKETDHATWAIEGPLTITEYDDPESAQNKFKWLLENEEIFQEGLDYIESAYRSYS